ncbi:MAG: cytochrome c [Acidobacteria bacterium]|nr:cytochrome c [Acidobacteriota bacterium]
MNETTMNGAKMNRTTSALTKAKLAAAILLVALACGGYAVASARASRAVRAATAGVGASDAQALYSRHCASCHGEDGDAKTEKGELYGATDFTSKRWWDKERPTDAQLRRAITAGRRGGMPAFGKKLSADEIAALAKYVRGFKGK